MKIKVLSIYLKIASVILIFLCVSACSADSDDIVVPMARFYVTGTIVENDGKGTPISGAKVALGLPYVYYGDTLIYYIDSLQTKGEGVFKLSILEFPQPQKFTLKIEDTGSIPDGRFETKTPRIDFINPSFSNGNGSWFAGEVERDLGIIKIDIIRNEDPTYNSGGEKNQ